MIVKYVFNTFLDCFGQLLILNPVQTYMTTEHSSSKVDLYLHNIHVPPTWLLRTVQSILAKYSKISAKTITQHLRRHQLGYSNTTAKYILTY